MDVPKLMRMSDVVPYLAERYGMKVTRQTVYNWANKGRNGVTLRTRLSAGQMLTTERWVDDFINSVPRR